MPISLAQILERKRQESVESGDMLAQSFARGRQNAAQVADAIAKAEKQKKEQELANRFNPINALASGGTALLLSGGNPVAAGLAALSSKRGSTDIIQSGVKGATSGLTVGALGGSSDVATQAAGQASGSGANTALSPVSGSEMMNKGLNTVKAFTQKENLPQSLNVIRALSAQTPEQNDAVLQSIQKQESDRLSAIKKDQDTESKRNFELKKIDYNNSKDKSIEAEKQKNRLELEGAKSDAQQKKELEKASRKSRETAIKRFEELKSFGQLPEEFDSPDGMKNYVQAYVKASLEGNFDGYNKSLINKKSKKEGRKARGFWSKMFGGEEETQKQETTPPEPQQENVAQDREQLKMEYKQYLESNNLDNNKANLDEFLKQRGLK